jgi:hypothetical protein
MSNSDIVGLKLEIRELMSCQIYGLAMQYLRYLFPILYLTKNTLNLYLIDILKFFYYQKFFSNNFRIPK